MKELLAMPLRMPMPAALADPAFVACLQEGFCNPQLLDEFNRLYRAELSDETYGRLGLPAIFQIVSDRDSADSPITRFVSFLHGQVYLRLPDSAVHEMRAATAQAANGEATPPRRP